HVGNDAVVLAAPPPAEPAEAADDLVEDEEGAGPIAPLAQALQLAFVRRIDAAGADDRLGDDGGDLSGPLGQDLVDGGQIVGRYLHHVREQRTETGLVER